MVRFLPDNVAWLRWILGPWVGILAATILFIATNAGIIGVSRLAFSLGQHRQLPRVLGRVHPTRLTPYVAIILFGVIAVILILPGEIPLLADLYAFGSMISFTAAHVSVIVLRRKEPDLRAAVPAAAQRRASAARPCRSPPCSAAMGTFAVWCVILYYKPLSGLIGIAWVGVGIVAYVIFRKAQGYSLTKTVKSPTLPASLQEDVVYDQLLVPVRDTAVSEEMMVLACQLATERKSSIDALYVIEVPLNLPIDASLPEERERARQVLERAAQRGGHVQREAHAGRRHGAVGGPGDRRRGHRPPLRGHRPRLAGQAAHRRQGVRPHHRLRAQQPALRGHHQRDPQDDGDRGGRAPAPPPSPPASARRRSCRPGAGARASVGERGRRPRRGGADGGVKRRAQGLRLGRYLPARPGAGGGCRRRAVEPAEPRGDGDAGEARLGPRPPAS